jgi:murein tripeptide amidase MpaA
MYSPDPDDLGEPPMSAELVRVADAMMPFNRERFEEAAKEMSTVMARIASVMRDAAATLLASDAFRRFSASFNKPREHRSAHRHAGTRDHRLRYAPARRDLPLGERTAAKALG